MIVRKTINEFRSQIEVRKYVFGKNSSGGIIKALVQFYPLWANLENIDGSRYLDNLQLTYSKAYKIRVRYEDSRQLTAKDELVINNLTYVIQTLTQLEEGRRSFNSMIAYTTGTSSNEGEPIYRVQKYIQFTGTGTEFSFQDDRLIGGTLLIIFRDGVEYRIVLTTPAQKQVKYDTETGSIDFSTAILPVQDGEMIDCYILQ